MKVSVAMATYNGGRFLRKQLDSILIQTYKEFELIICDDCSTDNTWQILEEYSQKDSRVKIFGNERNLGFKKNFERAVALCSGEYIALCDQDDIWADSHLEILLNNLDGATASVGNAAIMDADDNLGGDLLSGRDRYFVDGNNDDKLTRILYYGNPFQGTSSLYDKQLFEYALPIPEGVEYHDAWFAAVACCLNGLNFTYDVVTNYRIYGSNASGSHKWSLFEQIISSLKRTGWKTDRLFFCEELQNRIPNMLKNRMSIVQNANQFQKERIEGKKVKTIFRTIANYKRIYATDSYKHLFPRCLGILLKG